MRDFDRVTRCDPAVEPAIEIGGAVKTKVAQHRRSQARAVSIGAHEDHPFAAIRKPYVVVARARIEAPVEDRQRDVDRPGNRSMRAPVLAAPGVDQQGTVRNLLEKVARLHAIKSRPGGAEEFADASAGRCCETRSVAERPSRSGADGVSVVLACSQGPALSLRTCSGRLASCRTPFGERIGRTGSTRSPAGVLG
jgi:hypothetical protein